jgi:O-antigen/teichoic acid export membrane protein
LSSLVIVKNAVFNVLAFLVNLAVSIVLIPVMLEHLGVAGFGVWALVRAFVSYAALGDLGLTSAVTKYVAEYSATQRVDEMGKVLKSAFVLYLMIMLAVLVAAFLLKDPIINVFFAGGDVPSHEVTFVLYGSLIIFAVNTMFSIVPNALNGLQRMDLTNGVIAVHTLINGVGMYAAVAGGWGLRGIVWANAIAAIVALVLNGLLFVRHFPLPAIAKARIAVNDLRALFAFSKNVFVVSLATSIHQHLDKLLLSSFLNIRVVAAYEVGSRVVQQVRQIPVLMLTPLLPAASEFQAQEQTERVKELYLRSLKYLVVLSVPMLGCLGLYASDVIEVWIGSADPLIVPTLQILLVSNFINVLTGPGFFIAIGIGSARIPMYSALVGLSLNIVLSVVLLQWFGYFGAVFGSFGALTIASLYFLFMVHRRLAVGWKSVLRLVLPAFVAILPGYGAALLAGPFIEHTFARLAVDVGATVGFFAAILLLFRYFDDFDMRTLRGILKNVKGIAGTPSGGTP